MGELSRRQQQPQPQRRSPRHPRRFWTASEDATLRRLYPSRTAGEVAATLDRTAKAVHQRAKLLGLSKMERTDTGPSSGFPDRLAALHATGLTDPEIADRLGCERHTVSRCRRTLGLPSNRGADRYRRRVAEKTRQQVRAAGLRTLADVRVKAFRDRARAAGWPAELRPREVQILEALSANGPMTRPAIAAAIGMDWHGSRASLKCGGGRGSYLANLAAAGLVASLGRVVKGEGKGRSLNVYVLALATERGSY